MCGALRAGGADAQPDADGPCRRADSARTIHVRWLRDSLPMTAGAVASQKPPSWKYASGCSSFRRATESPTRRPPWVSIARLQHGRGLQDAEPRTHVAFVGYAAPRLTNVACRPRLRHDSVQDTREVRLVDEGRPNAVIARAIVGGRVLEAVLSCRCA